MKKIICVLLFATAFLTCFSQTNPDPKKKFTNQQIVDILNLSAELNGAMDIYGLDNKTLLVGDAVTYRLKNDSTISFTAKLADNYWVLGKQALEYQEANPGNPIVGPGKIENLADTTTSQDIAPIVNSSNENKNGIPWWVWLIVVGVLVLLFFATSKEAKKKRKEKIEAAKDPVTSGAPMREGGITDEQAPAYAHEVAARQFNRPNLAVTNITRGRLSGENLEVYYNGVATPQRRTFNDFPAYRGEVTVDNEQRFVYFLQGCGNDVRMGNYFSGQNITFIPEQVLQPTVQQTTATQLASEQPTVPVVTNMDAVVEMLKATHEKLLEKESADFSFDISGMKYNLKFSKGIIIPPSNHAQPASAEVKEVAN